VVDQPVAFQVVDRRGLDMEQEPVGGTVDRGVAFERVGCGKRGGPLDRDQVGLEAGESLPCLRARARRSRRVAAAAREDERRGEDGRESFHNTIVTGMTVLRRSIEARWRLFQR
jgi:hypothetical protein